MSNLRATAARLLAGALTQRTGLHQSLKKAQAALPDQRDIDFLQQLCVGVTRHAVSLSATLKLLLHKPMKKKDADVEALLLLGLYQLWHLSTPSYAAVSSTVEAARSLKKKWACGLVNSILRRALKEKDALQAKVAETPAQYDHPDWLLSAIQAAWPDNWLEIVAANNEQAPLTVRVQTHRCSVSEYTDQLDKAELEWDLIPSAPEAVIIHDAPAVPRLPGFEAGLFYVQDVAGQWVADCLDLKADLRVLDACAAPGSKTTHLLSREPSLYITALDNKANRLERLNQNMDRLQLPTARLSVVVADALDVDSWWDGQAFDRILVDAPCTATGVIRRHPDIRLMRSEMDVATHAELQLSLLNTLWPLLAKGGRLVYTTCSILPAENDEVITQFLSSHQDAVVKPLELPTGIPTQQGHQLLPTVMHDGFYYVAIERV